jgi:hypothetical protein
MPPFDHVSGLPGAYSRKAAKPQYTGLVFREGVGSFAQAPELNEMAEILEERIEDVGGFSARDGDRISGCDIDTDVPGSMLVLYDGVVWLRGAKRKVGAITFNGVNFTGELVVGVRITTSYVTELQDPDLKGLHAGSAGEGQRGAARRVETVSWGYQGDGASGDLYSVYLIKDGTIIDQRAPVVLSEINAQIGRYDREAHGNYIVRGCSVTALGKIGTDQHFSIEAGIANIAGLKRERRSALRHIEPETWDVQAVADETQIQTASPFTVTVNNGPLDQVTEITIEKQVTVQLVKGVNNAADNLPNAPSTQIMFVNQGGVVQGDGSFTGGTNYASPASWTKVGDTISWAAGGAEPAQGSTYNVTFRYREPIASGALILSGNSFVVTGGVAGGTTIVSYTFKLPRTDALCLDEDGLSVYLKGVSDRFNPRLPAIPDAVLKLCEISNTWVGAPVVTNNGTRRRVFDEISAMYNRLIDMIDLITQMRLHADIDRRYLTAKNGTFADPFIDDSYRDQGVAQTLALVDGRGMLDIIPTLHMLNAPLPIMLDYVVEYEVRQELVTSCMKINQFANFTPLPGEMKLTPAVDFWVEHGDPLFKSNITREFETVRETRSDLGTSGLGTTQRIVQVSEAVVDTRKETIKFLRAIPVQFTIKGFGAGEVLSTLTMDGINVKPAGVQTANASGSVTSTLTIPANTITAGTKLVKATGAGGSKAQANFTGRGVIETDIVQRTINVTNVREVGGGGGGNRDADPLAQTFAFNEPRFIVGFEFKLCAKGDAAKPIEIELRDVDNGYPGADVIAQKRIDVATTVLNQWTTADFTLPCFAAKDREFSQVIKTSDNVHAVSVAQIGKFDATQQKYVSKQPYTVGVLFNGSNNRAWTALQDMDLAFRVRVAKFTATTKRVNLGTFAVVNASDLMVRADTFLPAASTSIVFEIERQNGEKKKLRANQTWKLDQYISENVTVWAELKGTSKLSPVLMPNAILVAGELRATGTYVSKVMDIGAAAELSALMMHKKSAGATITVEHDFANNVWTALTPQAAKLLNEGWSEQKWTKPNVNGLKGRLRVTVTGTPAARPELSDFRAWSGV